MAFFGASLLAWAAAPPNQLHILNLDGRRQRWLDDYRARVRGAVRLGGE